MARFKPELITYLERIIEFDLARATEAAALNALTWMGKGDKDAAGSGRLWRDPWDVRSDSVLGRVVIGEGAKERLQGFFRVNNLTRGHLALSPQTLRSIRLTGRPSIYTGLPNVICDFGDGSGVVMSGPRYAGQTLAARRLGSKETGERRVRGRIE